MSRQKCQGSSCGRSLAKVSLSTPADTTRSKGQDRTGPQQSGPRDSSHRTGKTSLLQNSVPPGSNSPHANSCRRRTSLPPARSAGREPSGQPAPAAAEASSSPSAGPAPRSCGPGTSRFGREEAVSTRLPHSSWAPQTDLPLPSHATAGHQTRQQCPPASRARGPSWRCPSAPGPSAPDAGNSEQP